MNALVATLRGIISNVPYDEAIRLYDDGQYKEAISRFRAAIKHRRCSDNERRLSLFYIAESYAILGASALRDQRWPEACTAFQLALELNPEFADLHYQYALAKRGLHEYPDALFSLQQALKLNPRYAKAHMLKGVIYYQQLQCEQAFESFNIAFAYQPLFHCGFFKIGMELHRKGEFDKASTQFELAAMLSVDDIRFHQSQGDIMIAHGRFTEAAQEYRRALEPIPDDENLQRSLAKAIAGQS